MEEKGQINRVFIDGTFYTLVQRVYFLLVLLFLVSTTALTLSVLYEEGQSRIELQTKVMLKVPTSAITFIICLIAACPIR